MKTLSKVALSALMAFGVSSAAFAYEDRAKMEAKITAFDLISIEEAEKIAQSVKPGLIKDMEIDNINNGGGWKYEVEIYDEQGQEWEIDIHAKTGEVISVELD